MKLNCPHCSTPAANELALAGQTISCTDCGKSFEVSAEDAGDFFPMSMRLNDAPSRKRGWSSTVWILLTVFLIGFGGLVLLLGVGLIQSQGATRRMMSGNNIRQIAIVMRVYHDEHRSFPPAIVKDQNGKPLYSGLVLLLPYLEQAALYDQFQLDEPWDSPTNLPISNSAIKCFLNPASPKSKPGQCDYLLVGGPGSILDPAAAENTLDQVLDGTSRTIIVVETCQPSRTWAEPRVWDHTQPFESYHRVGYVIVGFGDGHIQALPKTTDKEMLKQLEQAADGLPREMPD